MQLLKRLIKTAAWTLLWVVFFWIFLIIGFPAETAKGWLAERLGKELNASVTVENLKVMWDLGIRLKGISIESRKRNFPDSQALAVNEDFMIKLDSLQANPRLITLLRLNPGADFKGSTPSGGTFSGSYAKQVMAVSFRDISFRDISISILPIPSASSVSGSGELKVIKGKGTIDVEVDGIPGGRQRFKLSGGEAPGLDGKMKVTVSLPKL